LTQKTALLSVYDKAGIVEFAEELVRLGWDIFSSGGTAAKLADAGVPVTDIQEIVGPAVLDHRVATLSRELHAGLLADYILHLDEMELLGFRYIDLVCVDLYPLDEAIAAPDATRESVIKQTDIGGPTMMLAGAKGDRVVISDPADRMRVITWLKAGEPDRAEFINELGAKAYFNDSRYRLLSAHYHSDGHYDGMLGERVLTCKYGENGWQTPAALYSTGSDDPLALDRFEVVAGAAPSYNNLAEIDRQLQTITHIAAGMETALDDLPFIAIGTKHGNPCGAALDSDDPVWVLQKMVMGDPRAIFGGLVMVNFGIDEALAEVLLSYGVTSGRRILDGISAPSFTDGAIEMLGRKGDKCRFLVNPALAFLDSSSLDTAPRKRYVRGGFLSQPNYGYVPDFRAIVEETGIDVQEYDLDDLVLAWAIGSTSNSNTITLVRRSQLIGNGVGQQDRVSCCELAIKRAVDAGHSTQGATAYSDSFFPFPDGPGILADAGVTAIWSTTGSLKDGETQALCAERGVRLFQTPDAEGRGFFGH
jgi:phosphoribosylaminoimidazolecarboxamide formyltransferase/IMP cyclohydrolase